MKKGVNDYFHNYHHPCVAHTLNLIVKSDAPKSTQVQELSMQRICRTFQARALAK